MSAPEFETGTHIKHTFNQNIKNSPQNLDPRRKPKVTYFIKSKSLNAANKQTKINSSSDFSS